MQCPKCKEGVIFTPKYGASGNNDLEESICPHCDGSGEIQEGDVWKCKIFWPLYKKIDDAFLFLKNDVWNMFSIQDSVEVEEEHEVCIVRPICRMKEVT